MAINTLSNEQRTVRIAKSTTNTSKRLSEQLLIKLGTTRRSELKGKIGNTGVPFKKLLNDYVNSL